MNRLQTVVCATMGVILVAGSACAGEKERDMTAEDWRKFGEAVSTQNEAQVTVTLERIKEACGFFAYLAYSGALTATPTNNIKEFSVCPYPPAFVTEYPLKMVAKVTLRDEAAGSQKYFMEKTATNTFWRLTEGWSVSTNGQKGAGLPLPSNTVQKEANREASAWVQEEE